MNTKRNNKHMIIASICIRVLGELAGLALLAAAGGILLFSSKPDAATPLLLFVAVSELHSIRINLSLRKDQSTEVKNMATMTAATTHQNP